MTRAELVLVARGWLRCFELRDADALVALYAEDARHTSPKLRVLRPESGGFLLGRAALREWWADAFARLPGLRYVERNLTIDGDRIFLEYTRQAPGEPDLPVAELFVVEAGLIKESRVYHG